MNIQNNAVKLAVFLSYARDYILFCGAPLPIDQLGPESLSILSALQARGLLTSLKEGNDLFIWITPEGAALAAQHGLEVSA